MSAYYNEYDKVTAAWLIELMEEGLIAEGVIDDRPIELVRPGELSDFTQCHFFAGIGGWSRALRLAGWPDDWPVWTGSCPCQSFSVAGEQRGFEDPRHLWPVFSELIAGCRPPTLFGEQVAAATECGGEIGGKYVSWLELVETDLGKAGYSFGAAVFPALYVGSPHLRERLYFVAHSGGGARPPHLRPDGDGLVDGFWSSAVWEYCPDGKKRARAPGIQLVADGIPGHVDLLRGAGNAIVPQQAAEFIAAYVEAVT
jgi:DNA (cytosine-5)-methyltransferase 1